MNPTCPTFHTVAVPQSPMWHDCWSEFRLASGSTQERQTVALLMDTTDGIVAPTREWLNRHGEITTAEGVACLLDRLGCLTSAEGIDPSGCPLQRAIASGRSLNLVLCLPRSDGWVVPQRISVTPVRGARSKKSGLIVREYVIPDARTGVDAEDPRSTGRLDMVVGGIAHDFNNLLVGILGFASLAEDTLKKDHPAHQFVEGIRNSAEQAAQLTRELLCYALGSSPDLEILALNPLIEECLDVLRPRIDAAASVHFEGTQSLGAVRADPAQIRQIVMNLILNASEASGAERGEIRVSTSRSSFEPPSQGVVPFAGQLPPGDYIRLTVRDNGCGIDGSTASHVFKPYVTMRRFGRGLGLAAVAGVVRGHEGAIRLESQVGIGSRFDVFLPMRRAETAHSASTTAVLQTGTGTILVLDDEPDVRRVLAAATERLGYRCVVAESARQAIEIFRGSADSIDLVILDMVMPDMDGEEVFNRLRLIDPEVRCVLSSGTSQSVTLRKTTLDHLAGFIQKPYRLNTLANKLHEAIHRRPE